VRDEYSLELLLKIRRRTGAEEGETAPLGLHLTLHELCIILLLLEISDKLFEDFYFFSGLPIETEKLHLGTCCP
jgi:hypothetical protein